jgi:hypothetical protein
MHACTIEVSAFMTQPPAATCAAAVEAPSDLAMESMAGRVTSSPASTARAKQSAPVVSTVTTWGDNPVSRSIS